MEAILWFLGISLFISWVFGIFQEDKIDLNPKIEQLEIQLEEKDKEIGRLRKQIEHLQTLVQNYQNRDGKSFKELIKEQGPIKGLGELVDDSKNASKPEEKWLPKESYDRWREQD
ncbi:MAG: hypothetical protein O3A78_12150 [Nitrospinae bacterium]|nr:hypothetical protein [Nitrospinota bacterium]MDA1110538.1 hypothetical protein [Nitrospinota bacterium]